jgi:hypothetical protein
MPIYNQFVYKFKYKSLYSNEWSTLQFHVDEFDKMNMNDSSIDIPLLEAMNNLNKLPKCYILQTLNSLNHMICPLKKMNKSMGKKIDLKIFMIALTLLA